jgi:hypothetical protein
MTAAVELMRDRPFVDTFAEKQLAKFGWAKGQALGAQGQGIKRAIEPQKRAAAIGIGAESVLADWGARWWEVACGKTMSRLKDDAPAATATPDDSSSDDEETKAVKKAREARKSLYLGAFVKAGEAPVAAVSELVVGEDAARAISYDVMLKACEGRTLSKSRGAKQTGKLQRLREADAAPLPPAARPASWSNFWTASREGSPNATRDTADAATAEPAKHSTSTSAADDDSAAPAASETDDAREKKKKKKKKDKRQASEVDETPAAEEAQAVDESRKTKKKKKSRSAAEAEAEEVADVAPAATDEDAPRETEAEREERRRLRREERKRKREACADSDAPPAKKSRSIGQ